MKGDEHVAGHDKNELLRKLMTDASPTSPLWEQLRMGIVVRCTEDIEAALKSFETTMAKNADASDKLAGRVFWLNVVLGTISAVGAAFTVMQFFKP